MATIKEIAKLAGVSRGTVDRVLNNRGGVNSETEARVRQIASSLNFTPSRAGLNLALCKKSLKLGYIIAGDSATNPFFNEVKVGIRKKAAELEEYGVSVEVADCSLGEVAQQVDIINSMVSGGINGLAIVPIDHPTIAECLKDTAAKGIPVVTATSDIHNSGRIAYVGSDYRKNGEVCAGLMGLITGGKASVGIIFGSASIRSHSLQVAGFVDKIAAKYPNINVAAMVENHDNDIDSFIATKTMLEQHPDLDALYIVSAGVYGACRAVTDLSLHPKIICSNCVAPTENLIREGIVHAAIDQQPVYQGSKPLSLLFNMAALKTMPKKEFYFTDSIIKLAENL